MKFLSLPPYYLKKSAKYTRKSRNFVKIFEILSLMVGAGGAIINYLFPGARGAPESKGAENIVSMEDIRLEQGLHEECGVFGIYDPEGSCAQTTYYGLYALQHRGQEACGIAAINDRELSYHKDLGLVGDVFDFWFEYRGVVPKGFVRVLGKLAELTDRGVRVVFFTGNHDMWVGDYLHRECGVEIHTEPQVVTLAGKRLFLAHGDNINVGHLPWLCFMNRVFRSRPLRWLFSWGVHPDWAVKFGRWWSGRSRKSHGGESDRSVTEPLIAYARDGQRIDPVDYYIFGHMHYARDYAADGLRVVLLGAWDAPACAVLDDAGKLELKRL